ncbi:MAG TPA: SRPBCC family protein [Ktedonobacterales bacterium]
MGSVRVAESAVINARPEEVYSILADYRNEHPRILPQQYFKELTIERGGQGAGTVFRARIRAFGSELKYHMEVTEPEPGHRLVETDKDAGVVTTFTVSPVDGGRRATLEIATEFTLSSGLRGAVEKVMNPLVVGRMYRTELQQVADYVASKQREKATE